MAARASSHPVREIVLPLGFVISLISNGWIVASSWGRHDEVQRQTTETLKAIATRVDKHDERLVSAENDIHDLKRDRDEEIKWRSTFEDFVHGRIDDPRRFPYHVPMSSGYNRRILITNSKESNP